MMVRIVRTGKRLPLRLDKLSQERFGDHRGSKCRESMTLTIKAASCAGPKPLNNQVAYVPLQPFAGAGRFDRRNVLTALG
jgi:hypothetical protein